MISIEEYIDKLIENKLDTKHWFITKQTMSDYYFPYYVAYIVDTYNEKHKVNQKFGEYYSQEFRDNLETNERFHKQHESENTYRNAIIAEYLGLIDREDGKKYATATVTNAYKTLEKYIKCYDDVEKNREIVDRQIEKLVLNVITNADKYKDVKEVTIFPVIFLYKILLELYYEFGDSKLTYEEFSIFVIRTLNYDSFENVIDLIKQYRNRDFSEKYSRKIHEILEHQSTKNVRFDALFGSLKNIDYVTNEYFRIHNNSESLNYIKSVVSLYEKSKWSSVTDKRELKEFMQSSYYFSGEIDNTTINTTVTQEEYATMLEEEDKFVLKVAELAEKYSIDGTTEVTTRVRLSSVQQAFRDKLIEEYGQKCFLCDVKHIDMLIASHIKDAAISDIYEKANFNNGLLLCANHDKLFDKFLITFNFYDGRILISKTLTDKEREICMLNDDIVLPEEILNDERKEFLMWHNEQFHKKEVER